MSYLKFASFTAVLVASGCLAQPEDNLEQGAEDVTAAVTPGWQLRTCNLDLPSGATGKAKFWWLDDGKGNKSSLHTEVITDWNKHYRVHAEVGHAGTELTHFPDGTTPPNN